MARAPTADRFIPVMETDGQARVCPPGGGAALHRAPVWAAQGKKRGPGHRMGPRGHPRLHGNQEGVGTVTAQHGHLLPRECNRDHVGILAPAPQILIQGPCLLHHPTRPSEGPGRQWLWGSGQRQHSDLGKQPRVSLLKGRDECAPSPARLWKTCVKAVSAWASCGCVGPQCGSHPGHSRLSAPSPGSPLACVCGSSCGVARPRGLSAFRAKLPVSSPQLSLAVPARRPAFFSLLGNSGPLMVLSVCCWPRSLSTKPPGSLRQAGSGPFL